MGALTIRLTDDHIFVQSEPGADATALNTVRLAVNGGVVDVAIDQSTPGLNAEIWDATAAAWWLPSVFGDRVTADVLAMDGRRDQTGENASPLESHADDQAPLADVLRRLALALWVRRWQPAYFDGKRASLVPWLLDAEAATIAVDASVVLSDDFPLAQALLEPHLAHLAAEVAAHHERADVPGIDAAIDYVLTAAADDALDLTPPDTPGWSVLAEVVAARSRDESLLAEALQDLNQQLARLDAVGTRGAVFAGASTAAVEEDADLRGSAPVDPRAVPARAVSFEDDAINWTVTREADGLLRFDVTVEGVGTVTHAIFVRVNLNDDGDAAPLTRTSDDYSAALWVRSDADPSEALVSVYGEIPFADTLPNRTVAERDLDRQEILRLARLRQSALRSEIGSEEWNAPFTAELADRARVRLR